MEEHRIVTWLFLIAMCFGVLAPFIYYAQYSGIVQFGLLGFTALIASLLVYSFGFHTPSQEYEKAESEEEWKRLLSTAERALKGYTLSQNILKESVTEAYLRLYALEKPEELKDFVESDVFNFLMKREAKAKRRKSGDEFYHMMEKIFTKEGVG